MPMAAALLFTAHSTAGKEMAKGLDMYRKGNVCGTEQHTHTHLHTNALTISLHEGPKTCRPPL